MWYVHSNDLEKCKPDNDPRGGFSLWSILLWNLQKHYTYANNIYQMGMRPEVMYHTYIISQMYVHSPAMQTSCIEASSHLLNCQVTDDVPKQKGQAGVKQ